MIPVPVPVYPLRMWLCASCALAQLMADLTVPEEPRGTEPARAVALYLADWCLHDSVVPRIDGTAVEARSR